MNLSSERRFTEEQLQLAWCRTKPGKIIASADGREIKVLTPGTWNLEAGPDFMNAKIAIDNQELQGSIEIHKRSSDWLSHDHNSNPLYDDIILHVVAEDDRDSISANLAEELPDAPVAVIQPRFSADRIAPTDRFPKGKCSTFFSSIDDDKLNLFFRKAGMRRFEGKVEFILAAMKRNGINSAFMELIFDACGYKQNRDSFGELYRRLLRYGDLSEDETEAVIWGESGLLPDPVSVELDPTMEHFVKKLWSIWWQIRKEPLPEIKWKRSGLRPMNFPERRIAAATMLMRMAGRQPLMFFAKFAEKCASPEDFSKSVIKALNCSHPVWDGYINFTSRCAVPASVLGKSRAEDICVNVVLPSLQAQLLLSGKREDRASANTRKSIPKLAFEAMHSIQSNRILETAALKWFAPPGRKRNIIKGAISQQGILHIYRNFCEVLCSECRECPLTRVFH